MKRCLARLPFPWAAQRHGERVCGRCVFKHATATMQAAMFASACFCATIVSDHECHVSVCVSEINGACTCVGVAGDAAHVRDCMRASRSCGLPNNRAVGSIIGVIERACSDRLNELLAVARAWPGVARKSLSEFLLFPRKHGFSSVRRLICSFFKNIYELPNYCSWLNSMHMHTDKHTKQALYCNWRRQRSTIKNTLYFNWGYTTRK